MCSVAENSKSFRTMEENQSPAIANSAPKKKSKKKEKKVKVSHQKPNDSSEIRVQSTNDDSIVSKSELFITLRLIFKDRLPDWVISMTIF